MIGMKLIWFKKSEFKFAFNGDLVSPFHEPWGTCGLWSENHLSAVINSRYGHWSLVV